MMLSRSNPEATTTAAKGAIEAVLQAEREAELYVQATAEHGDALRLAARQKAREIEGRAATRILMLHASAVRKAEKAIDRLRRDSQIRYQDVQRKLGEAARVQKAIGALADWLLGREPPAVTPSSRGVG